LGSCDLCETGSSSPDCDESPDCDKTRVVATGFPLVMGWLLLLPSVTVVLAAEDSLVWLEGFPIDRMVGNEVDLDIWGFFGGLLPCHIDEGWRSVTCGVMGDLEPR